MVNLPHPEKMMTVPLYVSHHFEHFETLLFFLHFDLPHRERVNTIIGKMSLKVFFPCCIKMNNLFFQENEQKQT